MKSKATLHALRWVGAAAFSFVTVAVQAAGGITVHRSDAAAIRTGMTTAEVRQILGQPAQVFKFRNATGPSWNYRISGSSGTLEFGIDFDAEGKVILAREYVVPHG
jgi:outer membrane protein assembly factor BamE (lipoprotein component of BamABCDE complex)